jgi:hypothetical protein
MEAVALGGLTPSKPPNIAALRKYNVNRVGQYEVIWQPLYEYQTYPTGGQTLLTFFQNTVGSIAGGKSTTNVVAAGQLPRPQEFLITGIQVTFEVGAAVFQVGVIQPNFQDVFDVSNSGNLDLFVGSKSYLTDAPIGVFPQQWGVYNDNAIGNLAVGTDYARPIGRYYSITPVKLPANQNFNVTLNWPEGVVTVATAAVIGVRLDGFLYRLSQ